MPDRPPVRNTRTAKWLGGRYDLKYFKGIPKYRRYRIAFVFILLVVALGWIGKQGATRQLHIYSPGPLSSAHSFFADQCTVCHLTVVNGVPQHGFFSRIAADEACQSCHQAPRHHLQGKQPTEPSCGSCHVEHQGLVRLVQVQDMECAKCHSDLKLKKDDTQVALHIVGFKRDQHPEFAALLQRFRKPPSIIFHHAKHMNGPLESLVDHKPVTLDCATCHRPEASEGHSPWKYRRIGLPFAPSPTLDSSRRLHPDAARELMTMPTFEKHCEGCHYVTVDDLLPEPLPHPESDKEVLALPGILRQRLREYIHKHPEKLQEPDPIEARRPEEARHPAPKNAEEWVQRRMAQAMWLLREKTCAYCHQLDSPDGLGGLPVVTKVEFKPRQMDDAVFSHEAHISVTCESCHNYPHSSDSLVMEKLLPELKTCQVCHSAHPAEAGRAENGCFLCHQYHKWDPQRDMVPSKHTVQELTGRVPPDSFPMEQSPTSK